MPIYQCMWAFVGIFTTILILARLDQLITEKSSGQFSLLIMAPLGDYIVMFLTIIAFWIYLMCVLLIGALTTTQWNLTAAPASQPRNAIFSQIIALFIAFSLHQITNLDPALRCALAPSTTAALTARYVCLENTRPVLH